MRLLGLALAMLSLAAVANPADVRYHSPSVYYVPGIYGGDYASESAINILPDVITSTADLLTPTTRSANPLILERSAGSLIPERTVEKR